MEIQSSKNIRMWISIFCISALAIVCFCLTAKAGDVESMENQSSELKNKLEGINKEIISIGSDIADAEEKIKETQGEIEKTEEQLAIAKNLENEQYEEMKVRIKYMYENDSVSLLEVVCEAQNMSDFLNKLEFIQNISEYDRGKLDELHTLQETIEEQEKHLVKEQKSQKEMMAQLSERRKELQTKADQTGADIDSLRQQIKEIKDEEARKAAEEELKRREAAAKKAAQEAAKKAAEEAERAAEASKNTSSGGGYDMPHEEGVLTKKKGVNYFNGHRETYYSQKVLPGGGLKIPGRHVASDGTIRDADGYICVASSDYPKGTVVQTSLGAGKVYDTGCASGTIDLYTDW